MFTPDHGKQSTCPAPLDRLTTTEEQLSTENSRSPLYWRISTKHWRRNRGTESRQEAFGKEKHGSGYFLNKRKVQRGSSRSKHKASKALAHPCLWGIRASNLKRRQQFHHQRKHNAQQAIGSEKEDIGREYMRYPEQNSTHQLLKAMDQTSTSFYQHDTQTYTPGTPSGELKATGQLSHNLQGKNTGQDPQPLKEAWSTARICSLKTTHLKWQHEQRQWQCLHNRHHRKSRNTASHTCHTEVGVQSAYKQRADKQITRSRHRASQSYKLISPTYKQAWQWQQWLQSSTVQLRADLFTSITFGVWPNRRHSTKRQGRVPDSITQSNSQSMWQHGSTLFTCVQPAKQRERWKVPLYTDRTNQNTQTTGTAELQHTNPHRPSTDGMGSTTLSMPDQQVSHQSCRVHKLERTMGTYTHRSPMWIWRNCNVHGPYIQTTTKAGAKVLQRYLARQVYINRCVLRRCCRQSGTTSTYSEETRGRSKVR